MSMPTVHAQLVADIGVGEPRHTRPRTYQTARGLVEVWLTDTGGALVHEPAANRWVALSAGEVDALISR